MTDTDDFILSKTRFESFSDGVFAIAITLLVLELQLPPSIGVPSGAQQIHDLSSIWPQYLTYFISFATVGIMWLNHHALFKNVERITHGTALANLLLLSLISFLPFPTVVLGRYGLTNVSVVYYGFTMTAISIAYNIVYQQVVAAHSGRMNGITLWGVIGLTLYPLASVVGYLVPVAGMLGMGALAVYYMQAKNMRSITLEP